MDIKYIIASAVCSVVIFGAYSTGYEKAETEATLKIESMKLDHANQIIEAQQKEKEKYENKTKELMVSYNNERTNYIKRVQQLERKLQSDTNMEALRNERDRCFGLAVRGERLLRRAESLIEGMK